ncbi:MAG TPA: endonuclease III [Steroidobacteraceae bacterium]
MTPAARHEVFARLQAADPNPSTELEYANPFQLLVSVVLSAQATDKSVNQATAALFRDAPTPEAMLALGVSGLATFIRSIGLYNTKARNLIETCRILIERYNGRVPNDRQALESLPGVGRKTANVILNVAFGQSTIAVDTHIFRVANRLGLAPGRTPFEVEQKLLEVVPEQFRRHAHHWLILHGRYVCIARNPKCPNCVLLDLCEYDQKTGNTARPARQRRQAVRSTRSRAPIARRKQ